MRVLFLTNTIVLPGQPGLPRPWRVAKHLCDQGHEVIVVANRRHYLDEVITVGGKLEEPLKVDGVSIIGVETSAGRRGSIFKRIKNYFSVSWGFWRAASFLEKPDVMIVGTPPPLIVPLIGWLLKHRFRCPAILEIRDLYPHTAVGMGVIKNALVIKVWTGMETFLQKRYDHIVAVVPGMVSLLEKNGVPNGKVSVITNGYDIDNDQTDVLSGEVALFFENHKDRFVACYGGNMGFANNISLMLDAAEHLLEDKRFVFVFFGEGQKKASYLETVAARKLDNVFFFPNLPRREISAVFRASSALMHAYYPSPLFDYALPNKIFEYHGAGVPLVFAGGGDVANLITTAGSGYTSRQGDSKAFAKSLCRLADDPKTAACMGENGRQYILANYRREKIFNRWGALVIELSKTSK